MKRLKILVLLLFFCLLASCHQSSETSVNGGAENGGAGPWIIPGVGTKYIYSITTPNDSVDPPTANTIEYTIISKGLQVGGKSNVVRFIDSGNGQSPSSSFYAIESNGNFSEGDPTNPDTIIWTTFPTGTQQVILDTPTNFFSLGELRVVTDVCSFIGTDDITTPAGNFSSLHVRDVNSTITIDTVESVHYNLVDTEDYWFAPSIGNYVKLMVSQTFQGQLSGSIVDYDLIKYIPH